MHVQHTFFLISKKNNFARAAHFFVHFLAVVLHDGNFFLLPIHTFYGGNVCFRVHSVFSLPLIFSLVAVSISHFLTAAI